MECFKFFYKRANYETNYKGVYGDNFFRCDDNNNCKWCNSKLNPELIYYMNGMGPTGLIDYNEYSFCSEKCKTLFKNNVKFCGYCYTTYYYKIKSYPNGRCRKDEPANQCLKSMDD